jgi:hypothetical protein
MVAAVCPHFFWGGSVIADATWAYHEHLDFGLKAR